VIHRSKVVIPMAIAMAALAGCAEQPSQSATIPPMPKPSVTAWTISISDPTGDWQHCVDTTTEMVESRPDDRPPTVIITLPSTATQSDANAVSDCISAQLTDGSVSANGPSASG
jgi:hypothetical protein